MTRKLATRRHQSQLTFYQYTICPFCNKSKALLHYSNTSYEAIEVNPLTQAEIKHLLPPDASRGKVPLLMIAHKSTEVGYDEDSVHLKRDKVMQDMQRRRQQRHQPLTNDTTVVRGSNEILRALMQLSSVQAGIKGKGGLSNSVKDDDGWTAFVDDELAPVLYPNICRSLGDAYRAFDYIHGVSSFSSFQKLTIRGAGSLAMYMAASRVMSKFAIECKLRALKPRCPFSSHMKITTEKRNITDERKALEDVLSTMERNGGLHQGRDFLSGESKPSLIADISAYGVLRSIAGMPAHTEMVLERNGPLRDWYRRMDDLVQSA